MVQDYNPNSNHEIWGLSDGYGNSKKEELVNKIYFQHKELFDYIIANRSSDVGEIKDRINIFLNENQWVLGSLSKPFIRFLTPSLDKLIPKGLFKEWKYGEAFLFEIRFNDKDDTVSVFCTIGPFDDPIRPILIKARSEERRVGKECRSR